MEARATSRFVRLTAQKARLVVELIRGKNVEAAMRILEFTPKRGAKIVAKTLKSAVANAEHDAERRRRRALREAGVRRRGADGEALPAARPRAGDADLQAHEPHHRHRRRRGQRRGGLSAWDRRYIRRASGWASSRAGTRAGSPSASTPICSTRTSKIRNFLKKRLYHAGVSKIEIERAANKAKINIHTARPGHRHREEGRGDREAQAGARTLTPKESFINIHEVRRPDLDAQLVAENVALQLERRVAFRRAMKEAVARAMRMGAQGIRIQSSGRLGGSEIARTEWYREGRVPLHTLRADVNYGFAEARPPTASSASRSGSSAARC